MVLIGDVPGENVVIKMPLKEKGSDRIEFTGAMEETHIIEIISDWLHYKDFIVEPREELLVR